jgi:hypothetical protein
MNAFLIQFVGGEAHSPNTFNKSFFGNAARDTQTQEKTP